MPENSGRPENRAYRKRELFALALLTGLAIVLFLFVAGLSRLYHSQEGSLATQWSNQGSADLKAQHFKDAVSDYRTALLYSRGNYSYQLNLAEALLGEGRTDEAKAYLVNLWSREPEDGIVNLELARIAARQGETERALRYYHNAIYATWPGNLEIERRNARLELVELLLRINDKAQAQSELIALAANIVNEPAEEAQVGDLFMRVQDYQRALAEYRLSLQGNSQATAALAGAGHAAFELGQYSAAQSYLQAVVTAVPSDAASAARLKTTEMVLKLDPFRQQIPIAERDRIVVEAFTAAGQRVNSCQAASDASAARLGPGLAQQWAKLAPEVTERGLRRDPDLVNSAMQLVFTIEHQANGACEAPTQADTALLLIANLHEGL